MTQGRSAGFASRVRITVDRSLPPSLGQKPWGQGLTTTVAWGQGLPTTVGQRLALTLGRRAARRVPRHTGGITGIRNLMGK